MRQQVLVCRRLLSNVNNRNHAQSSYLYETKRRDACANQRRERKKKCVRE
jgi:hypothetical protein